MDGPMDGWTNEWMNHWMDGPMGVWTNEWMDQWVDGPMVGWTNTGQWRFWGEPTRHVRRVVSSHTLKKHAGVNRGHVVFLVFTRQSDVRQQFGEQHSTNCP